MQQQTKNTPNQPKQRRKKHKILPKTNDQKTPRKPKIQESTRQIQKMDAQKNQQEKR